MKTMECKAELVVITGFGPFRQYLVNPSWEAVKVVFQLFVYTQWRKIDDWTSMVIHVGIASGVQCIILEQTGKNIGYKDRDVCGFCPVDNICILGETEWLDSIIDIKSTVKCLNRRGLDVTYSRDAGRYLCDFVFYLSLHYGQRRAALIHVPARASMASPQRLASQLQTIIQVMLCQLDSEIVKMLTSQQQGKNKKAH